MMAMSRAPLQRSLESHVLLARHQMRAPIPSEGKASAAAIGRKSASSTCRAPNSRRDGEGEDRCGFGGSVGDALEDMGASFLPCLLHYDSGAMVSNAYTFTRACSSVGKRSRASSTDRRVCSVTKYQTVV